jgi:hypothetical protein
LKMNEKTIIFKTKIWENLLMSLVEDVIDEK